MARKTILIVDDEPVVRALLKAALAPAGSRVVEAIDGSAALDVAWREQPDLVILDVGLPRLSGADVCRALKTNPRPPRVLLITGNVAEIDVAACGADGIIAKPFSPTALLEQVHSALGESVAA